MKAILKKFLLPFGMTFALLFASCGDIDEESTVVQEKGSTLELAQIRVAVDGGTDRSVIPVVSEDDYKNYNWKLYKKAATNDANYDETPIGQWDYDADGNSYTNMTSDTIGVVDGTYIFKLVAQSHWNTATNDNTTYSSVYVGETEAITISTTSATTITFKMKLASASTEITEDVEPGKVSISLSYTSGSVQDIVAELYKYDDNTGEFVNAVAYTLTSENGVYSASSVTPGNYVAVFTFYDALKSSEYKNVLGVWEEYVDVLAGLTSKGEVKISTVEDIYTISYVPLPPMKSGKTYRRSFTTNTKVTLPASYEMDETNDAFCGWYTNDSYEGTPLTTFDPTTPSGKAYRKNIKLYGKFIDAKEIPQIATVTAEFTLPETGAKTPHVGNIVKATATDSSGAEISGTLSYQWYAVDYADVEISDDAKIVGATSKTYKVTGSEVDKYLRVAVTQAYTVTTYPENVTDNDPRLYYIATTYTTPIKSNTTERIEPSTLNLASVTAQYGGKVIYGNKPDKDKLVLSLTSGGTLTDEYGNPVRNYEGDFANYEPLTATASLDVTIKADGYTITNAVKTVTVPVQYAEPDSSKVALKLSTDSAMDEVWAGQIMFDLPATDVEDGVYTGKWEYAAVSSLDAEPSDDAWNPVTTAAFPERKNGTVSTPAAIWVRVKSTGDSESRNLVYASEAVMVEVREENIAGATTTDKSISLLSGPEINALFTANFKTATSFKYSSVAPASGTSTVTISQSGDAYTEVKAWVASRVLYVYAEGYTGTVTTETVNGESVEKDGRIKLNADASGLFSGMTKLKTIDLSAFDTSDVTNMSGMFQDCAALTSITFGDRFTTSAVTDMSHMFDGVALTTLDLSKFTMSKVTDMTALFANSGFTSLDLSGISLATDDVTEIKMASLFSGCADLETITFGTGFNTSLVKDMSSMFAGCASLETLDLSKATFKTEKVTTMASMFNGCELLETLKLGSAFKTDIVTDMSYMFAGMASLADIDVSGFAVTNVKTFNYMFSGCSELTKIYAASGADWNSTSPSGATGVGMFASCSSLVGSSMSYSSTKTSIAYAKVDGGYFTAKTGN